MEDCRESYYKSELCQLLSSQFIVKLDSYLYVSSAHCAKVTLLGSADSPPLPCVRRM